MQQQPPLTDDERVELERLRAEVATLRSRLAASSTVAEGQVVAAGQHARQRWRTVVATLLIVVACLLAPLSVVAVWASNQVSDTDRYVQTMAPLAHDPAIQDAVANQITNQIFAHVNVKGLTTEAVDALASRGLPPRVEDGLRALSGPAANGVQSFTRSQVGRIVQSQAFANAWVQINRAAHAALVKALTGEGGGAVTVNDNTVSVNLAPFIQTVKQQLTAAGFSLAARVPQVNASFVLFRSADVAKAQSGFHLLNTLGNWLPVIVLLLVAIGVYVAKDHRRALVGAGLGAAAAMVVLALGLAIFRSVYLNAVPAQVLPHDAAAVLYDTIVRFLRLGLRAVLVLGLVVAAGAFLTGHSVTAVRTRQGLAHGIGWLRGGAERAGLRTGPVGVWVGAHKRALRVGAVAVAGLALVFWGRPTGKVVILLAVLLLVALALIELLGQPTKARSDGDDAFRSPPAGLGSRSRIP
jgi:hypothetical protein